MKKSVIVPGIVVIVLILILGAVFLIMPGFKGDNSTFSTQNSNNFAGEDRTIIHKDFRAIIKADWKEYEVPPSAFVYLPPNTDENDTRAEAITIYSGFLGEDNNYTLDSLLEQGLENSKKIIPLFQLTENTTGNIKGFDSRKIEFTGIQEGIERNFVQVFGIKSNTLYSITYSCPVDNCNSYDVYNSVVESFESTLTDKA
jgi:hypothetical protein